MAATPSSTLLRGGRVLIFDTEKRATFPVLDVLIEGTTTGPFRPVQSRRPELAKFGDFGILPVIRVALRKMQITTKREVSSCHLYVRRCVSM
jgi:hypothetical protein